MEVLTYAFYFSSVQLVYVDTYPTVSVTPVCLYKLKKKNEGKNPQLKNNNEEKKKGRTFFSFDYSLRHLINRTKSWNINSE